MQFGNFFMSMNSIQQYRTEQSQNGIIFYKEYSIGKTEKHKKCRLGIFMTLVSNNY